MTYPPKDYYKGIDCPGPLYCVIERLTDVDGTCRPTITELKALGPIHTWWYRLRIKVKRLLWEPDTPQLHCTSDELERLDYALDVAPALLTRLIDPALKEGEQIRLVLTPTEHVIKTTTHSELQDRNPKV